MDKYDSHLKSVIRMLNESEIEAEIRGVDTARFIFAKLRHRATEISWAGDDGVFIEYWKEQDDSESCKNETVESFEIATNNAIKWLNEKP